MSHDNPAKSSEPRWGDSEDRARERDGDKWHRPMLPVVFSQQLGVFVDASGRALNGIDILNTLNASAAPSIAASGRAEAERMPQESARADRASDYEAIVQRWWQHGEQAVITALKQNAAPQINAGSGGTKVLNGQVESPSVSNLPPFAGSKNAAPQAQVIEPGAQTGCKPAAAAQSSAATDEGSKP